MHLLFELYKAKIRRGGMLLLTEIGFIAGMLLLMRTQKDFYEEAGAVITLVVIVIVGYLLVFFLMYDQQKLATTPAWRNLPVSEGRFLIVNVASTLLAWLSWLAVQPAIMLATAVSTTSSKASFNWSTQRDLPWVLVGVLGVVALLVGTLALGQLWRFWANRLPHFKYTGRLLTWVILAVVFLQNFGHIQINWPQLPKSIQTISPWVALVGILVLIIGFSALDLALAKRTPQVKR